MDIILLLLDLEKTKKKDYIKICFLLKFIKKRIYCIELC